MEVLVEVHAGGDLILVPTFSRLDRYAGGRAADVDGATFDDLGDVFLLLRNEKRLTLLHAK